MRAVRAMTGGDDADDGLGRPSSASSPSTAAAALVTLAQAQGSSPREAGARMVVAPDGAFTGTIGGGALEWQRARRGAGAAGAARRRRCARARQGARPRPRPMLRRARAADDRAVRRRRSRRGRSAGGGGARGRADDDRARRHATAGWRAASRTATTARSPRPAYAVQSDGRSYEQFGDEPTRALSVRRRPCRPRAGPGAGAAAVRRHLDRPAARRVPRHVPANVTAVAQGDPVDAARARAGRRLRRW